MLSGPDIRRVAAVSSVDERTIERFLKGEPVRPSSRSRIREAMGALGLSERVTAIDDRPAPGAARIYGHASLYPELDQRERAQALNAHVTKIASQQADDSGSCRYARAYARELVTTLTKLSEQSGMPVETLARVVFSAMKAADEKKATK